MVDRRRIGSLAGWDIGGGLEEEAFWGNEEFAYLVCSRYGMVGLEQMKGCVNGF